MSDHPPATQLRLNPHEVTPLPGTRLGVLWTGDRPVAVTQDAQGVWNIGPLVRPDGPVLAYVCVLDHPELPSWPLTPIATRATYRSRVSHLA